MRVFAFHCVACAVAAAVHAGDSEKTSRTFLASLSHHGVDTSSSEEIVGEYERKTQSPMVWLNLHKSNLGVKTSWPSVGYDDFAARKLGEPDAA